MRASHVTKSLLLLLVALAAAPAPAGAGDDAATADGMAWLRRSFDRMRAHRTMEWTVTLEVLELPASVARRPGFPFSAGKSDWRFRVKGATRAWLRESRGEATALTAWYEGFDYFVALGDAENGLRSVTVGEGEADCLRQSLVGGGLLGWGLSHGLRSGTAGSGYVAAIAATVAGEEEVDGRRAVVVDADLGFGFGPERARNKAGTSRLWLDRESLLPIRRETTLSLPKSGGGEAIRVRETYSGYRLDEPIPDSAFHVEGMGEPDPLVDAPDDPAEFEALQTRRFLGFPPGRLPESGFSERAGDGESPEFRLEARAGTAPDEVRFGPTAARASAEGPDGIRLEAICCRSSRRLAPDHPFRSTRTNRRHLYGRSGYSPSDVYIGPTVDGKIVPALFFRDVGSHDTDPFDIAIDAEGRCHLVVADVDVFQANRLKLYWLVGDPATGQWEDARVVDEREEFTSWAHARVERRGDTVHLLWNWLRDARHEGPEGSGVYHLARSADGFGTRTRIHAGGTHDADLAVDPETGRLVALISTEREILAATLSAGGAWSAPVVIHTEPAGYGGRVRIRALGGDRFLVRSEREERREWTLIVE